MLKRSFLAAVLATCLMSPAFGHFVFVVPGTGGQAKVVLSETLAPDETVDVAMLKDLKLSVRDNAGTETAMALTKAEHAYTTTVAGAGTRVIHGKVDLGFTQRGEGKPHVLAYYPKTILGDAFDAKTQVGTAAPVELVPVGKIGDFRFKLIGRGKPLADAEVTVILPDGKETIVKTDKEGLTEAFKEQGRYGAWARFWEATPGERDGKKYDELRHYATLVIDATRFADPFAVLPEKTSSFGSVVSEGYLYVYGGHISPTHSYFVEAVSGKFARMSLASPGKWETLPAGPALQGMNLAAHQGKIYRVGGMAPHNKQGEPNDLRSIADVARFDPAKDKWEAMPGLPEARSSHDVAVVGDTLYVIGGWNLRGQENPVWVSSMLSLDLKNPNARWKALEAPFQRRALIVTAAGTKIYVIGGFDEQSNISRRVDIFDTATSTWTRGPDIPGDEHNGFAAAAGVLNGSVYASFADGGIYRINGNAWEKVGMGTPRLAHRIATTDKQILILGGADGGDNFDLVEALEPK